MLEGQISHDILALLVSKEVKKDSKWGDFTAKMQLASGLLKDGIGSGLPTMQGLKRVGIRLRISPSTGHIGTNTRKGPLR